MRTLSMGSEVFKMSTAHWIRVVGALSTGTTGSGSFGLDSDMERCERSGGGGGGSANSASRVGNAIYA